MKAARLQSSGQKKDWIDTFFDRMSTRAVICDQINGYRIVRRGTEIISDQWSVFLYTVVVNILVKFQFPIEYVALFEICESHQTVK